MDRVRARLVDAFTDEPFAGNPAGVVPHADDLDAAQMQTIAAELGASKTAFLTESASADRRVRYFTPTQEVDRCGHATVASFSVLAEEGVVEPGSSTLATNVGEFEIEVEPDGIVWMTQDAPTIRTVDVSHDEVASALGIDTAALTEIGDELPLAVASTGLPYLVVPATYLESVGSATPDLGAIEAITDAVEAVGIYLFTFDTLDADSTLHGRTFAPAAGVPEDPVTGTASCAVGAYLERYGALDGDEPYRFEQGHFVDRPGTVLVRVDDGQVGGRAVTVLDGSIAVPVDRDDDIIEV